MALAKKSYAFAVKQLKVYKVVTDDASEITYGSGIEIDEVNKLHFKPIFEEHDSKHNGQITDMLNELIGGEWALEGNLLDLDVISLLQGETLATTGTDTTEVHTMTLKASAEPVNFKIEAKVKYTGKNSTVKDAHVIIHKCQINTGIETSLEAGQYSKLPLSGKAFVPTYGGDDAEVRTIKTYATATDLST